MTQWALGDVTENCTNPRTDFTKAFAVGCRYAFTRATTTGVVVNGIPTLKVDAMYQANRPKLLAAGIQLLDYCWFDPRVSRLAASRQAEFFLSTVGTCRYPVIDIEDAPRSFIYYDAAGLNGARTWCETIQQALGVPPMIYTYPAFVDGLISKKYDVSWMNKYPLIVAHWDVPVPRIPFPWFPGSQRGWQYTASMSGAPFGFVLPTGTGSYRICMSVVEI
jgi:GH25 family lysozyme M1 (1,4-beta-N-acetylmuramidase)